MSEHKGNNSPVKETFCWYDFFKDVGTQVEESDILQASLIQTGVAETSHVGNYGQVFGTAKLNTEPRLTYTLPSMKSVFDEQEIVGPSTSKSTTADIQNELSSSEVYESREDLNNVKTSLFLSCPPSTFSSSCIMSSLPFVTSQSMASSPVTSGPTLLSSPVTSVDVILQPVTATATSVAITSAPVTSVTMSFPPVTSVMATSPMTSLTMTYDEIASPLMTSKTSFPPLLTVECLDSSKQRQSLSLKRPDGQDAKSRHNETPSPGSRDTGSHDSIHEDILDSGITISNVVKSISKNPLRSPCCSEVFSSSPCVSTTLDPSPSVVCYTSDGITSTKGDIWCGIRNLTVSPGFQDSPHQSCEETRNISTTNEKHGSTNVTENIEESISTQISPKQSTPAKRILENSIPEQSIPENSISEQSTVPQSIPERNTRAASNPAKSTMEQISSEQNSSEQSPPDQNIKGQMNSKQSLPGQSISEETTQAQISLEQSIPEETPLQITEQRAEAKTGDVETSVAVYQPEHVEFVVPTLQSLGRSVPETNNLEASTSGTSSLDASSSGTSSVEMSDMTASTSSAGGWESEQGPYLASGKKRRKSSARTGKGKRRKSKTVEYQGGKEKELVDRLPQNVGYAETSTEVEVTRGSDLAEEDTSPQSNRPPSLKRVSPPNTRRRSIARKASKPLAGHATSTSDVISMNDVMPDQLSIPKETDVAVKTSSPSRQSSSHRSAETSHQFTKLKRLSVNKGQKAETVISPNTGSSLSEGFQNEAMYSS